MKHVQHLNTQHRNQGWKMLVQFLFCIDFGTKPNWWHAVCCPMHRLGINHWQLFPFEYTGDMAFYETWHKCRSARAHATGHNGNQLREQLLFGVWLLLGTPLLSRQKWQHAWSSFTVYFFRSLVDVVVDMQNGFVLLFLRFEFFFCIKYEKKTRTERGTQHPCWAIRITFIWTISKWSTFHYEIRSHWFSRFSRCHIQVTVALMAAQFGHPDGE